MRLRLLGMASLILGVGSLVPGSAARAAVPEAHPHVIATVDVGDGPSGIAVNPRVNRAYVANFRADTMSVIDGSTNTVIATVDVGSQPAAAGVNARTGRVYVALQNGGVAVVDGRTN